MESLPVGLYENANFFSGFRLFFGNQKLKDIKKIPNFVMHHNTFQYGTIPIFGIPMQKIALKVEILVSPYKILLYLQRIQPCQYF